MPGKDAELPIRCELFGFCFQVKVQFRVPFEGFVEDGDRPLLGCCISSGDIAKNGKANQREDDIHCSQQSPLCNQVHYSVRKATPLGSLNALTWHLLTPQETPDC